jgi:hypothetical protein
MQNQRNKMTQRQDSFTPGRVWLDDRGARIHAHGGSILFLDGIFYWYGENKENAIPGSDIWHGGVNLYSSADMYNWRHEGIILHPSGDRNDPLHPARILDRPHIIYNRKDRRFVMWVKLAGTREDARDWRCQYMCVAVADSLTGPFNPVRFFHPLGMNSGDFDLVVDEGTAKAFIYFERTHSGLICADLSDDYLDVTGVHSVLFEYSGVPFSREAPAFFKRGGSLWLLTSGTTAYFPNPTEVMRAEHYHGPWETFGTCCVNDIRKNSFGAQFSSVFKHPHKEDLYIALGDRWLTDLPPDMPIVWDEVTNPGRKFNYNGYSAQNTSLADYVWLPVRFKGDRPYIAWEDEWRVEDFD